MIAPAAALVTAAVLALGYWINRRLRGWLPDDPPGAGRKQHARPIPLAGIVLLPAALGWLSFARLWWLAAAVAIVAVTGFLDDREKEHEREFGWRKKAVLLLIAAGLATMTAIDPVAQPWQFAAALMFVFALTNATNFLDNTDGVACSLSAVSLLWLTSGSGPLAAIGYAALGFLVFNWPRPIVFLGDAGAYLLGLSVAVAVLPAAQQDAPGAAAVAVQLADFTQVVVARMALALPPWVGDRRHLTHIAMNCGLPRLAVAPFFAGLALLAAWAATRLPA